MVLIDRTSYPLHSVAAQWLCSDMSGKAETPSVALALVWRAARPSTLQAQLPLLILAGTYRELESLCPFNRALISLNPPTPISSITWNVALSLLYNLTTMAWRRARASCKLLV